MPKQTFSVKELTQGILNSNTAALGRAITLVESLNKKHHDDANTIIENCISKASNSIRIGITGVPGVGKSTFIEAFGKLLTAMGKKVAVLAIDPSSSISKGSILGDKTRMQELVRNPAAFIRPSPSGESLGGVARKTRESVILCEAAGYDVLLIETVGIGQSETAVHSMVDFFLLLKLAGAGDELQGIKRGVIEMADALVINKADGDNIQRTKLAQAEFSRALHLYPPQENGWIPKVLTCSAVHEKGIREIWDMIEAYVSRMKETDFFEVKRQGQNRYWLRQTLDDQLKYRFYHLESVKQLLEKYTQLVSQHKISPFKAAEELLRIYEQNNHGKSSV